jgi:hypothetical protein
VTDRPIFIVGAQRSGTTLVRLMLDAHPSICIGPETLFVKHVSDGAARATGTDRTRKRQDTFTVGRDGIEAELAAAWARVLAQHAAENGAVRWGEKSPVHRYHGARIKRLFPDAQLLAVVRHPAAVCRSREKWGYETEKTVRDWKRTIRHHLKDAERFGPRQFMLLRYEDLLAQPRETMQQVLAFLGEPWDDAVLDHHTQADQGALTDGGTVMSDPLDPSRALAWTDDVDDEDLALLPQWAAEEMALVGYAADRAHPVLPLPENTLTRAPEPNPVRSVRRVVEERGAGDLARQALDDVRKLGVAKAVRKWRRRL